MPWRDSRKERKKAPSRHHSARNERPFHPLKGERREKCLVLRSDPRGRPYTCSDFMEALDRCGLGRRIAAIEPVPDSDDWVVKLATLAAAKTLLNKGAIKVKGLCCTVIQTETRKTEIDLQWVPFNLPDAAIRKVLQNYGVVTSVTSRMMGEGDAACATTTRVVCLYLKTGVGVDDLPYVVSYRDLEFQIVVEGRPPLCYKCGTVGHKRRYCKEPPCSKCDRFCKGKCARSVVEVAPPTGDAEGSQKVPLEPGDVQAAATAEGDSEEQSVSNQETVPVAEARAAHEPHDVKSDEETDNTSSDDESDSSDDGPPH